MRRTGSVEKGSRSAVSSRTARRTRPRIRYVMCVDNESNPESLELRKIYRVLPDADAAQHGYFRVVDESGQGYLYPGRYFIPVTLPRPLPKTARKAFT